MAKYNLKRYYLPDSVDDILEELQQDNPELESKSAALRYLIYERYKSYSYSKIQISAISKEVSIALELISSTADALAVPIQEREETQSYQETKEIVERRIKRNVSNRKFR